MERFISGAFSFVVTDTAAAGGDGPEGVAILLPGFPQDRRCRDRVMSALAGGSYRVLAPDLRGYSPGARPAARSAYRHSQLAAGVLAPVTALGATWRHNGWMDDGAERGLLVQVRGLQSGSEDFGQVLALAARVLAQDRYLVSSVPGAQESRVLGAFDGTRCAGFLRYLIQVIGAEAGRPAVMHHGEPLREGYVEAFGVDPRLRRRGIGIAE